MSDVNEQEVALEATATDSSTPQQKLIESLGKHVLITNPFYKEPFISILKYVGEADVITNDGLNFPIEQVKPAE